VRALGLDLGSRRIGVAVSDSDGRVAVPYEVVVRCGDRDRDRARIVELVEETEAEVVVVGLPLSLDGSSGRAAERAEAEVRRLRAVLAVPVTTYDERLTTVTAERSLREMQMTGAARRQVVDKVAAAVLLQGWLDQQAGGGEPTP
jgi:putative Holliday junction resolvase